MAPAARVTRTPANHDAKHLAHKKAPVPVGSLSNRRTYKMALSGMTVLVFGGSSGMGKAAAKTVLKL